MSGHGSRCSSGKAKTEDQNKEMGALSCTILKAKAMVAKILSTTRHVSISGNKELTGEKKGEHHGFVLKARVGAGIGQTS